MAERTDFELIISSCGKYSDLWNAHFLLLNENWKEHGSRTYLVTDTRTDRTFPGVDVICGGEGTEITERLKLVLEQVKTEYILFTLDDYFLTEPIDNEKLQQAFTVMKEENLDFMRLYELTKLELWREGAQEFQSHKGFYLRDTSEGNYKISLYPGIWKTDFMRQTLAEKLNAWQYEVALTEMADRLQARCAVSLHGEFPFLDVIRKGKVLRKADRYFKKHPIYQSERQVRTVWEELKLNTRTWIGRILPKWLFRAAKRLMIKCGMNFYSPVK